MTLADNLRQKAQLGQINASCLSITFENMRADVLNELFSRAGAKDAWQTFSEQANIKAFYEENDNTRVKSQVREELDSLMTVRNRIAHPSGEVEWPDLPKVERYVEFLQTLAESIAAVAKLYAVCLPDKSKKDGTSEFPGMGTEVEELGDAQGSQHDLAQLAHGNDGTLDGVWGVADVIATTDKTADNS